MEEEKKTEETKEEEKKTKEETNEEAKYTDEDVNKILSQKFAKWQEAKEKEISEAEKLANMTAEEKIKKEKEEIEIELNKLRDSQTKAEMTTIARNTLKEKGIDVDDNLISTLISKEADKTKENVELFSKSFTDAVNKAVLEKVKNPYDRKGSEPTMTREEILAIKDVALRQKKIKENMNLFK